MYKTAIESRYDILCIKTITDPELGSLSFYEGGRDIPFEIKRIYYITNVPEGGKRGHHAHKTLWQFMFCPSGRIEVTLDDGRERKSIVLDSPKQGLLLKPGLWREMRWLGRNAVLCVAASAFYSEEDYIRDYGAFLKYAAEKENARGSV